MCCQFCWFLLSPPRCPYCSRRATSLLADRFFYRRLSFNIPFSICLLLDFSILFYFTFFYLSSLRFLQSIFYVCPGRWLRQVCKRPQPKIQHRHRPLWEAEWHHQACGMCENLWGRLNRSRRVSLFSSWLWFELCVWLWLHRLSISGNSEVWISYSVSLRIPLHFDEWYFGKLRVRDQLWFPHLRLKGHEKEWQKKQRLFIKEKIRKRLEEGRSSGWGSHADRRDPRDWLGGCNVCLGRYRYSSWRLYCEWLPPRGSVCENRSDRVPKCFALDISLSRVISSCSSLSMYRFVHSRDILLVIFHTALRADDVTIPSTGRMTVGRHVLHNGAKTLLVDERRLLEAMQHVEGNVG